VVIHYTGDNSLTGALSWLCAKQSGVSAHLVIDKDGRVFQLVPFDKAAWHAGVSEYEGRSGVNSFSIGIENVGIGDVWPGAQVEAIRDILSAISKAYPIEDIVGHEDVAPGRKHVPRPRFPWDNVTGFSESEPESELTPAVPTPPVEIHRVEVPPVPEKVLSLWERIWKGLGR
jgi:N-acetyl-anhydromuramyl-L-alanine amidase AmpD